GTQLAADMQPAHAVPREVPWAGTRWELDQDLAIEEAAGGLVEGVSIQRVGAEIDREHGTLVRDGHVGVRTLLAVRILALSTVLADMQRAERSAAVELDRGDRPAA